MNLLEGSEQTQSTPTWGGVIKWETCSSLGPVIPKYTLPRVSGGGHGPSPQK